jgi:hypothetical protein
MDDMGSYTQFTGYFVSQKIPGLYWVTFIADYLMEYSHFVILSILSNINIPRFECDYERGYWKLQSCVSLSDFCEADWLPAQEYIESKTGKPLFFNRHLVGIPRDTF